jgi:biopolymer transport protein ExbD
MLRPCHAVIVVGRQLKLIVRFRMVKTPVFLLAVLVTLGSKSLPAQTKTAVDVRVSAETCLIGNLNVPCSDVGENLRKLGVPLDAHIHLSGDKRMTYSATSAALESLSRAGYKLKIGYVNVQPQSAFEI